MRRWARESARQLIALPLALVAAVLVPGNSNVRMLGAWDAYAMVYLALTYAAYRSGGSSAMREFASRTENRGLAGRLRLVSRPMQISRFAASIAMVTTVMVLPRADRVGAPLVLVLAVGLLAMATAWVSLQTGFAIEYVRLNAVEGGLEFPGGEKPVLSDFVYFAGAVGTTFGTTDVSVTTAGMRKLVTGHGILAFVFNTLILAVAITALTTYLAPSST